MCTNCPYIKYGKEIEINKRKEIWTLNRRFTCQIFNTVYMLKFPIEQCKQQYIGTTGGKLKLCLDEHRGYIINQVTSKAAVAHWNLPGHSLADLKVKILEKKKNVEYRQERVKYFIKRFDTFNRGINRKW